MSHDIETMAHAEVAGSNSLAHQAPWHNLSTPVSNDLTPDQMMEKAQLNWNVNRLRTYALIDNQIVDTERDVLVRSSDHKILTHVSEDWQPVQNKEAFDFFTEFVLSGNVEMNTAGSLKDGKVVWALAKIKGGSFDLFNGKDRVDSYLLFSNPHEYGKSVDIRFTAIRVVCNNTLTLALNNKTDLAVRLNHRRKFDPQMVKSTLGLASNNLDTYKEMAEFLASKPFSVENLASYYRDVFPSLSTKRREDATKLSRPAQVAMDVLDSQPGADLGKGTWWQVWNSTTYAIDHLFGRSEDTRLVSAWYGPNRSKKVEALNKAIEYANAA